MVDRIAPSNLLFEESRKPIHGPVAAELALREPIQQKPEELLLTFGVSQRQKPITSYSDVPPIPDPETTLTGSLHNIVTMVDELEKANAASTHSQISQAATAQRDLDTVRSEKETKILKEKAANANTQFYGKLATSVCSLASIFQGVVQKNPFVVATGVVSGIGAIAWNFSDESSWKLPLTLATSALGVTLCASYGGNWMSLFQNMKDWEKVHDALAILVRGGQCLAESTVSFKGAKSQYNVGMMQVDKTKHSHQIATLAKETQTQQERLAQSVKVSSQSTRAMLDQQAALDEAASQMLQRRS